SHKWCPPIPSHIEHNSDGHRGASLPGGVALGGVAPDHSKACTIKHAMLLCPVRDFHLALVREERRLLCPRGHTFDIARSRYINLLQPQERRSRQPGDTAAAIAARRRL